jgi:hypothetical protein
VPEKPFNYESAPHASPATTDVSVFRVLLFWGLYSLAGLVCFARIPIGNGIHDSWLGNTPGPASMQRYVIGWFCYTIAIVIIYVIWFRFRGRAWLVAPVLGYFSYLPGLIACAIARA